MEESSEAHSAEDKASYEKNKRRLKTPTQLTALEKFYNEHKYPTEDMKSQLAEQIGLTEKQISGWFCHRRLKDKRLLRDEVCAEGRQDRSSGVVQDRGSGLRQDSCGSTKQGDRRLFDPREVESRRLYGQNSPSADLTFEPKSHYAGNLAPLDDASSGSSSALQDGFGSQGTDKYDNCRPVAKHEGISSFNRISANDMRYRPSGYLKVKGEIENAAITAVKRQLGRHYREDGPLLGIEFDPLPPGAFESPLGESTYGPLYVEDPTVPQSPQIYGIQKQPSLNTQHEEYNSKFSSRKAYEEGEDFSTVDRLDYSDCRPHNQFKQRYTPSSQIGDLGGWKSSSHMQEYPTGDAYAYNNGRRSGLTSKHAAEGMRSDYASGHLHTTSAKITSRKRESWLNDHDSVHTEFVEKSEIVRPRLSNLVLQHSESFNAGEGGPSKRISKEEKRYREQETTAEYIEPLREKMHPPKEMASAKRVRTKFPQQDLVRKTSVVMPPWKKQMKGSAAQMPSSLSNDEAADTSSSLG